MKTKNKTGVVSATRQEFPLSTNVSSPIQAASRRRRAQGKTLDDSFGFHPNGYNRDDFVVSDRNATVGCEPDESSDGFEQIREAGRPRNLKQRQLGPPITIDKKLARLNPTHRMVVEDFVALAKEESDQVDLTQCEPFQLCFRNLRYIRFCSPKASGLIHFPIRF